MSNVNGLLSRLDKSLNKYAKKEKTEKPKEDWQYKMKAGKNELLFLTPSGSEDPFTEYFFHKGLQKVEWHTVQCDAGNSGENCTVCNISDELKKQDFTGNMKIWKTIEAKSEFYAPVIDLSSEETIEQGPRWARLTKTVMGQFVTWLKNLEKDEEPFYSETEPQKVIITFDPDKEGKDMYSLDKKNMKPFAKSILSAWKEVIKPVESYKFKNTPEKIKGLVSDYLQAIEDIVDDAPEEKVTEKVVEKKEVVKETVKAKVVVEDDEDEHTPEPVVKAEAKPSRLAGLKSRI